MKRRAELMRCLLPDHNRHESWFISKFYSSEGWTYKEGGRWKFGCYWQYVRSGYPDFTDIS